MPSTSGKQDYSDVLLQMVNILKRASIAFEIEINKDELFNQSHHLIDYLIHIYIYVYL